VAFSLPAAMLFLLLSKRPQLVIIALASAFFWLFSSLLTAGFWAILRLSGNNVWPFLMLVSTFFQEVCRYISVIAYRRTETLIKASSPQQPQVFPLNDLSSSLAAGVGFGAMHSLMMYGSVLSASSGDGVLFEESCPTFPLIVVSAFNSLAFFILDVIFTYLAFIAERTKSRLLFGFIFMIHLVSSFVTLGNKNSNGCEVSLSLLLIIVILSCCFMKWISPVMMKFV
jgi:hypothetical protein